MAPRRRILPPDSDADGEDLTAEVNAVPPSDEDDDDEDQHIIPDPGPSASREEFQKALRAAQVAMTALKFQVKDLKVELRTLRLQIRARHSTRQEPNVSEGAAKTPATTQEDRITLHARRFAVMNEMYLPCTAFMSKRPNGIRSDDPRWWESKTEALKGLIAELYEEVPADLHQMLEKHSSFRDLFRRKLSDQRRSVIHQLRNETAHRIFGHKAEYYSVDFDRSMLPEFSAELMFPGAAKFSKYAPILFPNRIKDMRVFLKCEHLALMLRTILFGPQSLKNKRPSAATVAHLWDVDMVTSGSIALVAVLWYAMQSIFLHSPDKKFSIIGSTTRIDYGNLFAQYKQIIVTCLQRNNERYINLMRWYNTQVFAWQEVQRGDDDGIDSGVEEALEENDGFMWDEVSFVDQRDLSDGEEHHFRPNESFNLPPPRPCSDDIAQAAVVGSVEDHARIGPSHAIGGASQDSERRAVRFQLSSTLSRVTVPSINPPIQDSACPSTSRLHHAIPPAVDSTSTLTRPLAHRGSDESGRVIHDQSVPLDAPQTRRSTRATTLATRSTARGAKGKQRAL